jgi:hypothetical protein
MNVISTAKTSVTNRPTGKEKSYVHRKSSESVLHRRS